MMRKGNKRKGNKNDGSTVQYPSELTEEIKRRLREAVRPFMKHREEVFHACMTVIEETMSTHRYKLERNAIEWLASAMINTAAGYYDIALDQLREAVGQVEKAHRIKVGIYEGKIRPGRKELFAEVLHDSL